MRGRLKPILNPKTPTPHTSNPKTLNAQILNPQRTNPKRQVREIEADIEEGGKYEKIEERCRNLIDTLLRGLTYYDTYDRSFLQFVIVAAYLGGAALLLEYVLSFYYPHADALQAASGDYMPSSGAQYLTIAAATLIVIQGSHWHYILYVALSVYLWDQV